MIYHSKNISYIVIFFASYIVKNYYPMWLGFIRMNDTVIVREFETSDFFGSSHYTFHKLDLRLKEGFEKNLIVDNFIPVCIEKHIKYDISFSAD